MMNKIFFRTCSMVGALAALVACGENTVGPNGAIAPKGPSYSETVPFNDAGACMADDAVAAPTGTIDGVKLGDDPATALNCTSNDVAIAHADLLSYAVIDPNTGNFGSDITYTGQTVECVEGDPIKLTLTAELDETATSSRTDIGIWIATDGGDAQTGLCNHYNLVNGSQGVSTETGNLIPDSCGDLAAGAVIAAFPLGTITTICTAGDNSQLHVGSCLGWKEPGADAVCPLADADPDSMPNWTTDSPTGFRFGTLYGNKSKCNCDGFDVPVTVLQKAYLEVVKACVPTSDAGLFNLQIDATTEAADAACGGTTGKKTVGAGTSDNPGESHSFGETAGTGTSLTNYTSTRTCVNRTGGAVRLADAAGTGGSVTLQPDDDVICTITNTRLASITITKVTAPASDPQDFAFTTTGTGLSNFSLDTDAGDATLSNTITFNNLNPGNYSVTEGANPTGWDFTSLVCGAGGSASGKVATITLAAGANVSCTYTNTKQGSITITKVTVPASDPQDFAFTTTGTGLSNFSLDTDAGDATLSNTTTFSNISAGNYSVTEGADPTGWDFTSLVCGTGGSASGKVATITLPAGGSVSCTYTNTKRASLVLAKVENGGLPLSRAWTFELRTGASTISAGTVVATASANVTTGVVTFPGTFTPGAYQLCETGMPVGYTNNITGFTPAGATPEGGDNSTECINITLVSGSNGPGGITGVPNPIDNVQPPPPGGDARTIGYWKNWSSCTGGKQYEKAAARNELNKTLDYYLPTGSALYPIGDITGTPALTCLQAVRLLGKSDMNSGKKMASDPAYNLAAQFIAAKLNVAAGAGTCTAATNAIAAAQTLLDAVNFTGTGSYKSSMTASQISQANSLASTLDSYNNNTLCP